MAEEEVTTPPLLEQMAALADAAAKAAAILEAKAASVRRDATACAKALREQNAIMLQMTGWFVSSAPCTAITKADSEFRSLWKRLSDEMADNRRAPQ